MKKLLLSLSVVGAFSAYSIHQRLEAQQATDVFNSNNSLSQTGSESTPSPTQTPMMNNSNMGMNNGNMGMRMNKTYNDGTYKSDVIDAFYGNVQVSITIANDKITDVQFLQYPQDRSTSRYISSQATPILASEAIQSQTADVNIVSGATQTSKGFRKAMQSALQKALI